MNNVHPTIKQILFTSTGITDKAMPTEAESVNTELLTALKAVIAHQNVVFDPSADSCDKCKSIIAQARADIAKAEAL